MCSYCVHLYKSPDIFSSLHSLDALVSNLLHTDSCRNSINHPVHWPLPGNFWIAISWTTSLFTYSSWSSAPPSALFTERVLPLPTVPHGHHWEKPEWSIRPSSSVFLNPRLTTLSFTQYNPFCLSIPWNWIFTHCHVFSSSPHCFIWVTISISQNTSYSNFILF